MNKETTAITLAGQQFAVSAPALGKLKKILSGMNRVSASNGDLDVIMTEAPLMIGLLISKTPEEMDSLVIGYSELIAAFNQVPGICGMVKRDVTPGEVQPGSV